MTGKVSRLLNSKAKFLLAIALATLVGGVAAGVAMATIPDSGGVIHACYRTSNGSTRIIDSAIQTCASNEAAINWNQTGPQGPPGIPGSSGVGKTLKVRIQGQLYGPVISESNTSEGKGPTFFYEPLQRLVSITYQSFVDPVTILRVIVGSGSGGLLYESSNCTGTAYIFLGDSNDIFGKTAIYSNLLNAGRNEYFIVERSQQLVVKTIGSAKSYDYKTETSSCDQRNEQMQVLPITRVSFPVADTLDSSSEPFEFVYE